MFYGPIGEFPCESESKVNVDLKKRKSKYAYL